MTTVPESALQDVLNKLIDATSKNDAVRKTAFRWFNRLYYDVRRWNELFIEFLHTYPGFTDSKSSYKYDQFFDELQDYRDSLEERYGTVKYDLCTNLKILSARYSRDFNWLYKEDEILYREIRGLIDDSYATEDQIIRVAYSVCNFIYDIRNTQDHNKIVKRICEYENASKQAVASLHEMADSVGIHLLDIAEYQAIVNNEGSTNPNVMIIGEITMSKENIHIEGVIGPVNVKSRLDQVTQIVRNAPAVADNQKQELSDLIEKLKQALEPIANVQPEDSQRVVQAAEMVAAEVAKEKPNKSFLTITTEGLKEAAKAVEVIAPSVLSVATQIATFAAGLF